MRQLRPWMRLKQAMGRRVPDRAGNVAPAMAKGDPVLRLLATGEND
jgi:hypothetical protein